MKALLEKIVDQIIWSSETKEAIQAVIKTFDNKTESWKAVDKLRIVLGLKNYQPGAPNDDTYCGSLTDKQITLTAAEQAELLQLQRGEVEVNESSLKNYVKLHNLVLSKNSTWFYAGDGAVFDIDFNGVDHILAKGDNVKTIVFCNQVYANTGGQYSKNSIIGQVAKNCYNGVDVPDKQFGQMMIAAYGRGIYVAQVSLGYNRVQAIKAIREAEEFNGPAIVLCYCPCINHLINGGMTNSERQQKLAVECGVWPVFRWNGALEKGKRLAVEFERKAKIEDFIGNEQRFMALQTRDPARFEALKAKLASNVDEVCARLELMKGM